MPLVELMYLIFTRYSSHLPFLVNTRYINSNRCTYPWWNLCTSYLLGIFLTWHASKYKYINSNRGTYFWWSLCTLYLLACQVRVTVGDSGLCCCVCVTSFLAYYVCFHPLPFHYCLLYTDIDVIYISLSLSLS